MSINKSFVVRNGFEASTNLILADADTRKVGVGTTAPQYTLHVSGGIGVTDAYVSGIGTFANELNVGLDGTVLTVLGIGNSIGIGTALPAFLLDIRSPVSTGQTAFYVQGDIEVTGDIRADDILITNLNVSGVSTFVGSATFNNNILVAGIGTVTTLNSTSGTITNLTGTSGTITTLNSTSGTITNLTGTSGTITNLTGTAATIGAVQISSGIITATSGIVTFFGDGQYLDLTLNASTGIGIGTTGGVVGYGITFIDFYGAGVSTTFYNSSVGIATIFFEGGGGGGGGTIGIGTEFPLSSVNGDLFFSAEFGRLFIYYDENIIGVGTDEYWIDAAPFNVGIITALTNVSFSPGSALAPSMFFIGDGQTGFFSPALGQFTVVSSGSSVLNINPSGINVTGITTITNTSGTVTIGIGTTALLVEGNARVTGILTVGSSSITLNGITDTINVGTGLTLSSSGIIAGVITATSFVGDGSGLTGVGVGTDDNINTTGIITASTVSAQEFIGTGDKLIFSPTITSFSPTDGATGVSALSSPNIVLTYNQQVGLGTTGTITLREDNAGGTIVESYEVGVSTRATVSNQTLTIDPTDNFDYDQEYFVVVPQGGITNFIGGNSKLLDTYNFTTEAGPTLSSVSPGIGSTDVAFAANVIFTFNKNIRAGVGTITLRTVSAGGTIVESYDVASSGRLTFSTDTLTIDPTSNLGVGVTHFVVVPNNAVAGYVGIDTYSFTTVNFVFQSIAPVNGATAVALNTNITLTFNVPPTRGTGTIELRRDTVGGTIIESFNAASSGRISISSNDWILDPTSNLPDGPTTIFLVIPSTAIQNYVGLNTAGADSHSFATVAAPALGDSYEGGFLICKASPLRWVVSPYSAEVGRTWYLREDANTTAQSASGCTGWFVPTRPQLQNPGYCCRSFWGPSPCFSSTNYWSSTEFNASTACYVLFTGGANNYGKTDTRCVRAFRCVTY